MKEVKHIQKPERKYQINVEMLHIYSQLQFPIAADNLDDGQVLPRNAKNNWNNESVSLTESLQFYSKPARKGNTPDWRKSGGGAATDSERG